MTDGAALQFHWVGVEDLLAFAELYVLSGHRRGFDTRRDGPREIAVGPWKPTFGADIL